MKLFILENYDGFVIVDEHNDCLGKVLINPLVSLEKRIDVKETLKLKFETK